MPDNIVTRSIKLDPGQAAVAIHEKQALEAQLSWYLLQEFNTRLLSRRKRVLGLSVPAPSPMLEVLRVSAAAALGELIGVAERALSALNAPPPNPLPAPAVGLGRSLEHNAFRPLLRSNGLVFHRRNPDSPLEPPSDLSESPRDPSSPTRKDSWQRAFENLTTLRAKAETFLIEDVLDLAQVYCQAIELRESGDAEQQVLQSYRSAGWDELWGPPARARARRLVDQRRAHLQSRDASEVTLEHILSWLSGGSLMLRLKDGVLREREENFPVDPLHRVDQALGLVPSSDFAGETSNILYFLHRFEANEGRFRDLNFLLPLAAIAAGSHHSILETVLPVTLTDRHGGAVSHVPVIDYHVGYYDTLLPFNALPHATAVGHPIRSIADLLDRATEKTGAHDRTFETAATNLKSRFQAWDRLGHNHHLLVFYNQSERNQDFAPKVPSIGGAYLLSPQDERVGGPWYQFCQATKLVAFFKANPLGLHLYPTQQEIERLMFHITGEPGPVGEH